MTKNRDLTEAEQKAFDYLTDDPESRGLCDYCPIPDESRHLRPGPDGPLYGCEGSRCDAAFESWREDADQCVVCGKLLNISDMTVFTDMSDGNKVYVCENCQKE